MARCLNRLVAASVLASSVFAATSCALTDSAACRAADGASASADAEDDAGLVDEEAASLPGPVNLVQMNVDLNEVSAQRATYEAFVNQLPFADFVQLSGSEDVGARVSAPAKGPDQDPAVGTAEEDIAGAVDSDARATSEVAHIDVDGTISFEGRVEETSASRPKPSLSLLQRPEGQEAPPRSAASAENVNSTERADSVAGAIMAANSTATLAEPALDSGVAAVVGQLSRFFSRYAPLPSTMVQSGLQWLFLVLFLVALAVLQATSVLRSPSRPSVQSPPRGKQSDEALGYLFRHWQLEKERQAALPGQPGFVGYTRM